MLFFLPLFALLPAILADTVSLALPLAAQNPSVALAGKPYSFNVSHETFTTDSSVLTYSTANLPSWLTFDSASLCFYGTAPALETATSGLTRTIRLTATTADGHASSDSFPLTVESSQGVTLLNPLGDQFKAGDPAITSAYGLYPLSPLFPGIRVPPGWSFSVGFLPVFQAVNKRKVYYLATQPDGSALPEWLHFNNNTITFDGITPSPAALERKGSDGVFKVRLWGSDVRGIMDQYQDFTIRVATKTIEQVRPLAMNLTAGYPLTEPIDLFSAFRISGRQLARSDLAAFDVDGTAYSINLDNSTISGSPPAGYGGRVETIYMSMMSQDGDAINTTLSVTYFGAFFTGDKLGPVHVVPGDRINIPITRFLANRTSSYDVNATFEPAQASSWVSLDETQMAITGDVPSDSGIQNVTVHLTALDKEHGTKSYAALVLNMSDKEEATVAEGKSKGGLSGAVIGGIVAAVLLNVILALVFLWMWMKRRQRRQAGEAGEKAEGYDDDTDVNQDPERFAAGPIYRPESFMEVQDENAVAEENERGPGEPTMVPLAGEKAGKMGPGWHKRTSTVPTTVLMTALAHDLQPASPGFAPGTPNSQITRQTDSPGSIASAASKARKFLANPFIATKVRQVPVISNPILHPSFSNAAFQASLAVAVDAKGIVSRGGTFDEEGMGRGAPTATTTISEFTPSGTYVGDQTYGASTAFTNGYTTSGGEGEGETDFDRPTSEYTARYTTTDVTGSEGFEVGRDAAESGHASAAGDSSVVGKRGSGESGEEWKSNKDSDRASWESGAPFVWNTEVGGGVGTEAAEESEEDNGMESRRGSTQAETTEYGWTEEGGMTEETFDSDPPVQRSDFRPRSDSSSGSPGGSHLSSGYDDRNSMSVDHGSSVRGTIRHEVVTPSHETEMEAADFSIDNIHFPTESDIARTEASSDPSELDPSTAVIATASRISARHTLDSPISGCGSGFADSPQSDYTERMPHSPVSQAQSRLVNLGNQRKVVVRPLSAGRREESQTAVLDSESENGTRVSYYEYPDEDALEGEADPSSPSGGSGETTPQARPRRVSVIRSSAHPGNDSVPPLPTGVSVASMRSNASSKKGKHRARNSSVSSRHIDRSRSPTPPMPESFPSLPALPTGRSLASAKSFKSVIAPNSNRSSTNTSSSTSSSRLPPQTRVLLGVNEPFHFYPPLLLASPTGLSSTTAYTLNTTYTSSDGKPLTPEGARYEVYEEKRGTGDVIRLESMPEWLHWEDMELWGVPGQEVKGRWDVRVVEIKDGAERVVGRFALEVVGR
ncbi:uncharacterized protein MKK02DRAFT_34059 [Dioszegia hungarica]|uniref:Dystroglycan-type cadherin-like domain-containing protein n=1 Tax=Dioszegia hungarica TaxID=4972 RepID=A0AA38HB64_9TREE|nr:uncharacterized protein MKK02DRAFT_34059 [Dioszegia hungarica]KAI9636997.1 hypothetical protein MKK02DRAFT_34059 [Dioszegia hungarica]